MTNELADLKKLINTLYRFNTLDTRMQVSTILTYLEIAHAVMGKQDITPGELEKRTGVASGTSSRNVYYWADGHPDMRGAYKFVTVNIDPMDRRKRELGLTPQGRAFVHALIGDLHGTAKRDQVSS
jgi:DNA-binding MarR family transcriptional regulator